MTSDSSRGMQSLCREKLLPPLLTLKWGWALVGLGDHVKLLKHTSCRACRGVSEMFSPASLFALFYLPCSPFHLIPSCSVGHDTPLGFELMKPLNRAKENCLEVLPLLLPPVSWSWLSFKQDSTAFSLLASPSFLWHCFLSIVLVQGGRSSKGCPFPCWFYHWLLLDHDRSPANICRCHLWECLSHTCMVEGAYSCHLHTSITKGKGRSVFALNGACLHDVCAEGQAIKIESLSHSVSFHQSMASSEKANI